jgi:hypothetical protein
MHAKGLLKRHPSNPLQGRLPKATLVPAKKNGGANDKASTATSSTPAAPSSRPSKPCCPSRATRVGRSRIPVRGQHLLLPLDTCCSSSGSCSCSCRSAWPTEREEGSAWRPVSSAKTATGANLFDVQTVACHTQTKTHTDTDAHTSDTHTSRQAHKHTQTTHKQHTNNTQTTHKQHTNKQTSTQAPGEYKLKKIHGQPSSRRPKCRKSPPP